VTQSRKSAAATTRRPVRPKKDPGSAALRLLVQRVRAGLSTAEVRAFIDSSLLDRDRVLRIVSVSKRTLERRATATLSPEQSDRLARLRRVYDFAADMIGDRDRARMWLGTPSRALDGNVPLDLLDTDAGTRLVEDTLLRISDGAFA
jgi:putative toxin-antitoxin system antitoxin component (TIGR02293 family)